MAWHGGPGLLVSALSLVAVLVIMAAGLVRTVRSARKR